MDPPSKKRKRSVTCAVLNCANSEYNLEVWRDNICDVHNVTRRSDACSCKEPYSLFTFPSKTKRADAHNKWRQLINRASPKNPAKLMTARPKQRVCSKHFVGGELSYEHPYPTLCLGYESASRTEKFVPSATRRRKLSYSTSSSKKQTSKTEKVDPNIESPCISSIASNSDINIDIQSPGTSIESCISSPLPELLSPNSTVSSMFSPPQEMISPNLVSHQDNADFIVSDSTKERELLLNSLSENILKLKAKNKLLKKKIKSLTTTKNLFKNQFNKQSATLNMLHKSVNNCSCKLPLYKSLLKSDKKCDFYTGIITLKLFEHLHDIITPLVRRRWRGVKKTSTGIFRNFKKIPKRFGPARKLCSKDEFLLFLMKLRLGLLNEDLADRFSISEGLVSGIIASWLKASSSVLSNMVEVPEKGNITATLPERFKSMPDIHSILDATEVFIETPKNLDLQRSTWSQYKHHNTLKILVCIAPNSSIIFLSKAYGGAISDKEVTNKCGYLDLVPSYSQIMYDKGFNLTKECESRFISIAVPPGKRGSAQMTPAEIRKTKRIANLRILVEQVIRRLKSFRILGSEYPISMIKLFDDVVIVCGALCNLRKSII